MCTYSRGRQISVQYRKRESGCINEMTSTKLLFASISFLVVVFFLRLMSLFVGGGELARVLF